MKLAKVIVTWVVNSCSMLLLAFTLSGAVAEQAAGEIKLPPRVPDVDTAQYHYAKRILTSKDHLHDIHVAIKITLDPIGMPTTLRVENFDANIESCEDRELPAPESDIIDLEVKSSEFVKYHESVKHYNYWGECRPSGCWGDGRTVVVCTKDCGWRTVTILRDEIKVYQGRNQAGQLFKFKWRAFVAGKANKNPLSSFTLTSGSTFAEPEPELLLERKLLPDKFINPWWRQEALREQQKALREQQKALREQQKIAAHFCD